MTSNNMTPAGGNGNGPVNPIAYRGIPVLTTERLAEAYGTDEKVLQNNFSRNQGRFTEKVHFFKVVGADLKALKTDPLWEGQFDKRAPALILWTERGARRHAKILDNDVAWQVFEQLEDTYFAVKDGRIEAPAPAKTLPRINGKLLEQLMSFPAKMRAAFPSLGDSAIQAAFSKLSGQVLGEPLLPLPKTEKMYTAGEIAEEHSISPQRLGRITNEAGIPRDEATGGYQLGQSEHSSRQVEHWRWNAHGKSLVDAAIADWKRGQLFPPANSNDKKPDADSGVA